MRIIISELVEVIKKSIKILKINKDSITIGSEKGCWSKGLEMGNKEIK